MIAPCRSGPQSVDHRMNRLLFDLANEIGDLFCRRRACMNCGASAKDYKKARSSKLAPHNRSRLRLDAGEIVDRRSHIWAAIAEAKAHDPKTAPMLLRMRGCSRCNGLR
jgi:hypothetical protein